MLTKSRYSRPHDIYSLGIVLLELGLWKTLDQDIEVENADFEKVKRGALSSVTGLEGFVVPFLSSLSLSLLL